MTRPLRRLRAARRDAGEGREGRQGAEAEARVARPRFTESTRHARPGAEAARLPREVGVHPDDGEPIVANFGRFGPYVKHGDRVPLARIGRRRVRGHARSSAVELFRAAEEVSRAAERRAKVLKALGERPDSGEAGAGARRPLRSVRHRRHDQRVAAQGRRSGHLTIAEAMELLKAREAAAAPPQRQRRRARAPRRRGGRAGEGQGRARAERSVKQASSRRTHVRPHRRRRGWPAAKRPGRPPRAASASSLHEMRPVRADRRPQDRSAAPSWCAATRSAATSSITPSACSRKRCGGSARW